MDILTTMVNFIELKINFGDVLSIVIALLALCYTIHSTRDNQRKSVLPFLSIEPVNSSLKIVGHKIEDNITDYIVVVRKNKKMYGIEKWGEEERKIIENGEKLGTGFIAYGAYNFPQSIKLKNIGKNTALSFTFELGEKNPYPKVIGVNEEKIISILLEDQNSTFNLFLRFKDIYGNEYKEKIEFFKGRMYLYSELKKVKFSKTRKYMIKQRSRLRIIKQEKNK
ncbi:hypothetical protein [Lactococcus lactis]|uniref:Phage protein n=1 Tax=Lactococcus lactis TaxID=1358 RepID=A0AAW5TV62_9LACT|nr:hypothetical protein [Lactococcus lactis]MCW2282162.1 hypothetical protein [Lactococcus lactis]